MISGVGAGAVYATCVGNAVKWFPDHRGLAVGLTAAGFGAGAAVTVIPIQRMIASVGYADTFFWFALIQGGVVFVLAWLLRAPLPVEVPNGSAVKVLQSKTSSTPGQVLSSPIFWLLYLMFVLVSASGLMVTAQIAVIAKDYGVAQRVVLFGATVLIVSGVIDNLANGSARPFFGWVSDQIGREYTMGIAFTSGGIAYWLLGIAGTTPWTFVICAASSSSPGERSSVCSPRPPPIFRAELGHDQHRLALYCEGIFAFVVPLANVLKSYTGSWHAVFVVASILNILHGGGQALFVRTADADFALRVTEQERGGTACRMK